MASANRLPRGDSRSPARSIGVGNDLERDALQIANALKLRRHRRCRRGIGDDHLAFVPRVSARGRAVATGFARLGVEVCPGADISAGEEVNIRDLLGAAIDGDIHPSEGTTAGEGFDYCDPFNLVSQTGVCLTRDDDVHQSSRQPPRYLENLGLSLARREIGRVSEAVASSSRMSHDDDELGPFSAQLRCVVLDDRSEGDDTQTVRVRRERRSQRANRHDTDDADSDAGRIDQYRGPHVGPVDGLFRGVILQVGRKERRVRSGGDGLEGAAWVGVRRECRGGTPSTAPKSNS